MSLSVLAKIQASQYGAALEAEDGAVAKQKVARNEQLHSIEAIKNDKVGAVEQKEIQEKKGFLGMLGGIAVGIGVVVACVAIVVASALTFGAAAVVIGGAIAAAAAATAAGRKVGHDVWGKVNAVEAAVLEKAAGFEQLDLTREQGTAKDAQDSAEDAAATADDAEKFAKQIRQGMSNENEPSEEQS